MRHASRVLLIVIQLCSFHLRAEGLPPGGLPPEREDRPRREEPRRPEWTDLFEGVIDDQRVYLDGEWSEEQKQTLLIGVRMAATDRVSREADISELTEIRSIRFTIGEALAHDPFKVIYSHPANLWGSGIGGSMTHTYTIPADATAEDIADFLAGRLPDELIRDERKLATFQNRVARAHGGGSRPSIFGGMCNFLLAGFRSSH